MQSLELIERVRAGEYVEDVVSEVAGRRRTTAAQRRASAKNLVKARRSRWQGVGREFSKGASEYLRVAGGKNIRTSAAAGGIYGAFLGGGHPGDSFETRVARGALKGAATGVAGAGTGAIAAGAGRAIAHLTGATPKEKLQTQKTAGKLGKYAGHLSALYGMRRLGKRTA